MFHTKKKYLAFAVALLLLSLGCTNKNEKGFENNPIQVSLIPSKEAGSLLSAGTEFKKWMEAETGYVFNVSVPNSYVAVVESIGSQRTDIAFLTTNSYLMAFKKYQSEAHFITVSKDGSTTYRGQIIVKNNSKINKLIDLNNKKVAYVDPSSSSGYLLPANLLKQKNIKPSQVVFAGKHDAVVTMVYQGQVDAGATFYSPSEDGVIKDARRLVKTQYPDVEQKIKILDFTETLPNDALVFRKDLPLNIKIKIENAIEKWAKTPEGLATLKALNNGAGLKKVTDNDYTSARTMLTAMEQELK